MVNRLKEINESNMIVSLRVFMRLQFSDEMKKKCPFVHDYGTC